MSVRMKDIARDLGVSVVTVSKALRNYSDISEETKKRVRKRAKELNYSPDFAARALVTGRTYMLGLVVPSLVHPFFAELAKGMSLVLRKEGYGVVIASSEEHPEIEQQAIDQLVARRVDALLVASAQWTAESFHRLEEHKVPYILVDRSLDGLSANFVGTDNEMVGLQATEHLIEIGCRTIAHVAGSRLSPAQGRLAGYQRALVQHGLPADERYIARVAHIDEDADVAGYRATQQLLNLKPRPDGIFCFNDPVATGAMRAIFDSGLRIPEDIAVAGCGNLPYDDLLRVPLTSVDQQSDMTGQQAAKLALMLVESKSPPAPQSILLEPRLVVRASTVRASARQAITNN